MSVTLLTLKLRLRVQFAYCLDGSFASQRNVVSVSQESKMNGMKKQPPPRCKLSTIMDLNIRH